VAGRNVASVEAGLKAHAATDGATRAVIAINRVPKHRAANATARSVAIVRATASRANRARRVSRVHRVKVVAMVSSNVRRATSRFPKMPRAWQPTQQNCRVRNNRPRAAMAKRVKAADVVVVVVAAVVVIAANAQHKTDLPRAARLKRRPTQLQVKCRRRTLHRLARMKLINTKPFTPRLRPSRRVR